MPRRSRRVLFFSSKTVAIRLTLIMFLVPKKKTGFGSFSFKFFVPIRVCISLIFIVYFLSRSDRVVVCSFLTDVFVDFRIFPVTIYFLVDFCAVCIDNTI